MAAFGICIQNFFETSLNFRGLYVFLISYLLAPKIEICLPYILDTNSQKQP